MMGKTSKKMGGMMPMAKGMKGATGAKAPKPKMGYGGAKKPVGKGMK